MDGKIELSEVQSILNSSKIGFTDMFPLSAISSGVLLENNSVNRDSLVDLTMLKNVTWTTVLEEPNIKSSYNSTNTWVNNSGKRTSSVESVQQVRNGFNGSSTVHSKTDTITTESTTSTSSTTVTSQTNQQTSIIPYMRQRRIYFTASGLRPNAIIYATFDGEDVTQYVTQIYGNKLSGKKLQASQNGFLIGFFDLPAGRFKTGERKLAFTDSLDPLVAPTTTAEGTYTAVGFKNEITTTNQYNTVTTTQKHINIVEEDKTYTRRNSIAASGGRDPVAQSFTCSTVDAANGIYVKSIELYFFEVDLNDEVMVEIRGVTNGYPNSSLLYDYSWTKKAGVDIKASVNGSVSTKFEFYTPIFLPSNAEYCFVVLCNTTKTSIWCSELGKKAFLPTDYTEPTGELISKQPYLGSMFISQNSTTWTAEQTKDVKFKINRCKFKNSGNLKLVNSSTKDIYRYPFTKVLPANSLKFTEGSKEVTLYIEGHGWVFDDNFTIYLGDDVEAKLFGILKSEISGIPLKVKNYTPTYVTFDVKTAAIGTGSAGGTSSYVNGWVNAFSAVQLLSNDIMLDNTSIGYLMKGRTQSNYENMNETEYDLGPDEIIDLKQVFVTKSDKDGGISINCPMTTNDVNISPMLNINALGIETHFNIINNVDYFDENGNKNKDSSPAKYVQKTVNLVNPANELKVFFESNLPSGTSAFVYYKVGNTQIDTETEWKKINPDAGSLIYSDNENEYRTQEFTLNTDTYTWDTFKVMIVLTSSNRVLTPKIKNYRAIALNV